jgi:hypothetical protein
MSKKDEWRNCDQCENEFKIISSNDVIGFCPFCGFELEDVLEEDIDEEDWPEDPWGK